MKNKIYTILSVFILFLILIIPNIKQNYKEPDSHKILKVIEADEFYIDINDNNKIDDGEHFKIKDVISLKPYKYSKLNEKVDKLGLKLNQYLKVGYLARKYAVDNFEGKNVVISNILEDKVRNLKYANITLNNDDIGEMLIRKGLGVVYHNSKDARYLKYQNIRTIKSNAKALKDDDFVLVNLKNNLYHKINSDHIENISNGEVYMVKDLNSTHIPCKGCFKDKETKKIDYKDDYNIEKPKGTYKTSIYKNFGYIESYYINPLENKKPTTNCSTLICKRIVSEINNSKSSIDIALYEIDNQKEILNALNNAKNRNVKVRIVTDKSKNEHYNEKLNFIKNFSYSMDNSKSLMHNKFIIFDNKKVLTGSMNFTNTGFSYNSNSCYIINSSLVAKYYFDEFNQMFNNKFSSNKSKSINNLITLGNTKISVNFLPDDDFYNKVILPEIKNAKSEIFVSIFYLTDRNLINDLIEAKKRNVNVMVLIDALGAINFKERINKLKENKIPVIVENWGGKNHQKTILIDGKTLITGSANFSKSGFYKNDENVLVIKDKAISEFYRDYYLYLFNSIDRKYLRLIPRAESFESINSCFDGIDNNFDGLIDKDDIGCKQR